jgi:hypothetical protein
VGPGTGKEVVTYEVDHSAGGSSFLGIYGRTQNPPVEYCIVDSAAAVVPLVAMVR